MDTLKRIPTWLAIVLLVIVGFLVLQGVNYWATESADNTDCLVTGEPC